MLSVESSVILGSVGLLVLLLLPLLIQGILWINTKRSHPQLLFEPTNIGMIVVNLLAIFLLPFSLCIIFLFTAIAIPIVGGMLYIVYIILSVKPSLALLRKMSTTGVDKLITVIRRNYPRIVYNVECYHYETRHKTDSDGKTQTSTERVTTYRGSYMVMLNAWWDRSPALYLPDFPLYWVKMRPFIVYEGSSHAYLAGYRNFLYRFFRFYDTHVSILMSVHVNGLHEDNIVSKTGSMPCYFNYCLSVASIAFLQGAALFTLFRRKATTVKYAVVKHVVVDTSLPFIAMMHKGFMGNRLAGMASMFFNERAAIRAVPTSQTGNVVVAQSKSPGLRSEELQSADWDGAVPEISPDRARMEMKSFLSGGPADPHALEAATMPKIENDLPLFTDKYNTDHLKLYDNAEKTTKLETP